MWIENRFAIGNELVRCLSFNRDVLAEKIRKKGFEVVSFDGDMGHEKPIELLFIVEKRRNVPSLINLIKTLDSTAVYSVSDVKSVYEGPGPVGRRMFFLGRFKLDAEQPNMARVFVIDSLVFGLPESKSNYKSCAKIRRGDECPLAVRIAGKRG
ncbi:DUF2179 domain-containing protein [Teredinibacter franksiae]|uniref:DUF2179 domain-containing protein n=1 Tax=Teredinibacter franksiae TaxID=2761453 RepID=UPI001FE91D62|nr:DUF2179 domain-containing protein [Teredinibacter franksiae]